MCNPSQHMLDMYEVTIRNMLVDGDGNQFPIGRPKLGRYRCDLREGGQVPLLPWTVVSHDDGRELPDETRYLDYHGLRICVRRLHPPVKHGGNETG